MGTHPLPDDADRDESRSVAPPAHSRADLVDSVADLCLDAIDCGVEPEEAVDALRDVETEIERATEGGR